MALADQLRHKAVQEGEQQRADMCAVHIGICHDNDLVVPKLADVKVLMNPGAEGGDHGAYLRIAVNPVKPRFFYVEDFSAQGKDRLV